MKLSNQITMLSNAIDDGYDALADNMEFLNNLVVERMYNQPSAECDAVFNRTVVEIRETRAALAKGIRSLRSLESC